MKPPSWNGRPPAFTLVELLITIGIIVILVVLAVPQYSRMTSSSLQASCASRLRSIVQAWMLYCDDQNGFSVPYTSTPTTSWAFKLMPYVTGADQLNASQVFECPAAKKISKTQYGSSTTGFSGWMGVANGNRNIGYGINSYWYSDPETYTGANAEVIGSKFYKKKLNGRATEGPVFADSTWWDFKRDSGVPSNFETPSAATCAIARHRGRGINMAYPDGSVQYVTMGQLFSTVKLNPSEQLDPSWAGKVPPKYR